MTCGSMVIQYFVETIIISAVFSYEMERIQESYKRSANRKVSYYGGWIRGYSWHVASESERSGQEENIPVSQVGCGSHAAEEFGKLQANKSVKILLKN